MPSYFGVGTCTCDFTPFEAGYNVMSPGYRRDHQKVLARASQTFLVEVVFHDVRELPYGLERLADL